MTVDDLVSAGLAALSAGRWDQARDAFDAALATDPAHGVALDGLGEALWWLGEPRRSIELKERAYAGFRRAGDHARAIGTAIGVAITYYANFDNAVAAAGWAARAQRLLSGEDDPLAGWVAMAAGYVSTDLSVARELSERAVAAARASGDADLELVSMGVLGATLVAAGEVERGLALIDEAMAGTLGGECTRLDTVVYISCDMLTACDLAADVERARQWCQVVDRFIASYGCPFLNARCRILYGGVLVASGQWADAERELLAAIDMCDGAGPAMAAEAHARLADLRLRQGRLEEAGALLRGREDEVRAAVAAAALRLASGDAAAAVTLLRRRLRHTAAGHVEAAPALALLVRALVAQGRLAEASETSTRLTHLAGAQRHPYTAALAAATSALMASSIMDAAGESTEEVLAQLETALRLFTQLGLPFEAARTRMEIARIEAAGRPEVALVEAEAALETFERLGATIDADAAAALLRTLGGAPRPGRRASGALTERERQVLQLIQCGLSNPEIAARLHISRKTAAHHVSNVLAKLGVRNRTEAAALARTPA